MSLTKEKRKQPDKPSEYCFTIESKLNISNVSDEIKEFVEKIYKNNIYKDYFKKDEELPFTVSVSIKNKLVCIKPRRTIKVIARIDSIHNEIKDSHLKMNKNITLGKPSVFTVEQHKWWVDDKETTAKMKKGQWWSTLEHNGPYFQWIMEPYVPHGIPLVYDGKDYKLTPEEEENANFYSTRKTTDETATIAWTKDTLFNKNFWNDFKTYLTPLHKKIFKDFDKISFEKIRKTLIKIKETETSEQKKKKKVLNDEKKHDYGFAIVNGVKEPIGNFVIEPSSIYVGRGDNKKRGSIKRNITPNEVTINIGKGVKIPEAPKGYKWKEVVHDKNARWIMSWKMPLTGDHKYVYISAEGQFKGKSDKGKFEKSRKLNRYIENIRKGYQKSIDSDNKTQQQLGTVLYLIDHYGIRVGGANDDSTADTFGASTLLVSHTKLVSPDKVILEFLGKDSILFKKTMNVPKQIFKNLQSFVKGKSDKNELFNLVSASDINNYLKSFDKDLSAKVFRTRIASDMMYNALKKVHIKKSDSSSDKKKAFENVNIIVAETLNHQRTVSKKADDVIKKYKSQLIELENELKSKKKDKKSVKSLEKSIQNKKNMIDSNENLKSIAINTSKMNYIDPRLVVSWCKENDLDISKIYTSTMQKKFKWAIDTTQSDWDYEKSDLLPGFEKLEPITNLTSYDTKPKKSKTKTDNSKYVCNGDVCTLRLSKTKDIKEIKESDMNVTKIIKKYEQLLKKYGYSLFLLQDGRSIVKRTISIKSIMLLESTYKNIYDVCVELIKEDFTYLAFLLISGVCRDSVKNPLMKKIIISSKYKDKYINLVKRY